MAKHVKLKLSVDDQLTEHLKKSEEELIAAVNLFTKHKTLNRRVGYFTRLVRAQELITGLHREELVRLRGAHRKGRK